MVKPREQDPPMKVEIAPVAPLVEQKVEVVEPAPQIVKDENYLADTFAKFGLNMNLYQPGGQEAQAEPARKVDTTSGFGDFDSQQMQSSITPRGVVVDPLDKLVDSLVPDLSYLLESHLHMQTLFE